MLTKQLLDRVIHPLFDRSYKHDFLDLAHAKPKHIVVEPDNPRGEYETAVFATGRLIEIEQRLPYIWPVAEPKSDSFERALPYIWSLAFQVPSGQIVNAPQYLELDLVSPRTFKKHPLEPGEAVLQYPEAQSLLQLDQGHKDINGDDLDFDMKGYPSLLFNLSLPLTGLFTKHGQLIVEAAHTWCNWVSETSDGTRVSESPWRNAFRLVGFELALAQDLPGIYNPHKDN